MVSYFIAVSLLELQQRLISLLDPTGLHFQRHAVDRHLTQLQVILSTSDGDGHVTTRAALAIDNADRASAGFCDGPTARERRRVSSRQRVAWIQSTAGLYKCKPS